MDVNEATVKGSTVSGYSMVVANMFDLKNRVSRQKQLAMDKKYGTRLRNSYKSKVIML